MAHCGNRGSKTGRSVQSHMVGVHRIGGDSGPAFDLDSQDDWVRLEALYRDLGFVVNKDGAYFVEVADERD